VQDKTYIFVFSSTSSFGIHFNPLFS